MAALALFTLTVPVDAAPAPGCEVLSGQGEARTGRAGAWAPIARGGRVAPGMELRASSDGLRFCVVKGAVVDLEPGGVAELRGETRVSAPGAAILAHELALSAGELSIEGTTSRWSGPLRAPVLVRGPGDVLALDVGGGLRARVTGTSLLASAYRVDALVSSQHALKPLRAGHAVSLRAGAAPTARALLPAPVWIADSGAAVPGPLAIVGTPDAGGVLGARFAAVPGATGYEAEIARDATFGDLAARVSLTAAETTITSPPLRAGRYFARVGARGADGLRGPSSAARELRVARLDLPPAAALVGGIVVVPPGPRPTWQDPAGLELSRGGAPFAPAARELPSDDSDQGTALRVRLAGDTSFLPLTVAPILIEAQLDLGPKTATWPSDPVWITAAVVTPSGAPASYEPALEVTVNRDPVTLSWQRDGHLLRATVPPQRGRGPWTVRVLAKDRYGRELGFGMLEVIEKR